MNDLVKAARDALDLIEKIDTGIYSTDEVVSNLIAAVERAEKQEAVRLSDDEICKIAGTSRAAEGKAMLPVAFARAIEKAIWEKNK